VRYSSTGSWPSVSPAAVAPTITAQPVNQTVTTGQTATFSVLATGTAPLSYQWQKNGANISGATSASYTTPATTSTDNGSTFKVVVSNSVGSVTSNAWMLTLNAVALRWSVPLPPDKRCHGLRNHHCPRHRFGQRSGYLGSARG
jgi:hypothetical protein